MEPLILNIVIPAGILWFLGFLLAALVVKSFL